MSLLQLSADVAVAVLTFFLFKNSKVAFLLILSLFPVEYIFTTL